MAFSFGSRKHLEFERVHSVRAFILLPCTTEQTPYHAFSVLPKLQNATSQQIERQRLLMPAEFFFFSLFLQNLPRSFIASPAFLRFQYPLFYKCYLYSARFCLYLKYTEIKEKLFPLKSVAIAPESLR